MTRTLTMICKDLSGRVPSEIQVIPAGAYTTAKGDFVCDAVSRQLVLSDYETRVNDMVVDYEHQTLQDVQAPAAGWVKGRIGLEDRGEAGIWAKVDWTDKAREYIANREYRYVSPVFSVRKSDNRVVALLNVALTNQPNIDGMVPIANKLDKLKGGSMDLREIVCKKLGCPATCTDQELLGTLDKALNDETRTTANKLLAALGLSADASLESAEKTLAKIKEQASVMANKDVQTALGLKDDTKAGEATAIILAMKQGDAQGAALAGKVALLEDQLKKRDADEAITLAMKEGKITPATRDWAEKYALSDLEGFKTFVSKAPAVVPVGELSRDTVDREEPTTMTLVNKATAYRAEQAKNGIDITVSEAVAHVAKGGK